MEPIDENATTFISDEDVLKNLDLIKVICDCQKGGSYLMEGFLEWEPIMNGDGPYLGTAFRITSFYPDESKLTTKGRYNKTDRDYDDVKFVVTNLVAAHTSRVADGAKDEESGKLPL